MFPRTATHAAVRVTGKPAAFLWEHHSQLKEQLNTMVTQTSVSGRNFFEEEQSEPLT